MMQAEIVHELDELLEQQSQMDVRMAAFQHMLYVVNTSNGTRLISLIHLHKPTALIQYSVPYRILMCTPIHCTLCRPNLRTLHSDSSELSEAVTRASNLAESVSSKVRLLDVAKV